MTGAFDVQDILQCLRDVTMAESSTDEATVNQLQEELHEVVELIENKASQLQVLRSIGIS